MQVYQKYMYNILLHFVDILMFYMFIHKIN